MELLEAGACIAPFNNEGFIVACIKVISCSRKVRENENIVLLR